MNNDPQARPDGPERDERTADSAVPPTQQLPSDEVPATSALPAAPSSDDPLAVFDEPVRSPEPAPMKAGSSTSADDSGHDAGAGSDAGATAAAAPLVRTGPRTTTIVWGLIVVAIGVGLLSLSAGATIDVELAAILVLGAAGLLLVVGSVAGGVRRRRQTTA